MNDEITTKDLEEARDRMLASTPKPSVYPPCRATRREGPRVWHCSRPVGHEGDHLDAGAALFWPNDR